MADTTLSIPNAIRAAFMVWLISPDNTNRARFEEEKYLEYKSHLTFPNSKIPYDLRNHKEEKQKWSNQKSDALRNYELVNGQVFRKPAGKYAQRKVIQQGQVFEAIVDCHLRLQHSGIIKTFQLVQERFYGISRQEVTWLLQHCTYCLQDQACRTRAPLQPIQSNYTLERIQIDLVDMRARPHKSHHWILHVKDHFSKITFLYALLDKTAAGVAKCMAQLMGIIGFPKIIQCDNGNEFKGELLILCKQHGIKIINGRARHPQSQGLVEQANGVMKKKLRYWLAEHQGQGWSDALPEIALAMNRQGHKSLGGKMPYEVFFGRKPRWEDLAEQEPQEDEEYVEFEAEEAVEEEDSFTGLSEINIFDENPVQPSSLQPTNPQPSSAQPSSMQALSMQASSIQVLSVQDSSVQDSSVQDSSVQPSSLPPTSSQPIPIDPLLLSSAANTDLSELGTQSVSLTPTEESVLAAGARARNQMANRYNKRFIIENFEIGAIISLRIPKEDRGTLDYSRLYARVLAQPHPGRYELQTAHGTLDRLFPTADLNRVPSLTAATIVIEPNPTSISLHHAAALASQVTEVLLYCTCQHPASCGTRRCKCYKFGAKCTNYCHRSSEVTDTCINLAPIEERNIRILVPRVPDSSLATNAPDPDNTPDNTRRKRRASRLSSSEGTAHNLRSTRSRQEANPVPMESPTDTSLGDDLDTIVVRKS